MDPLTLLRRYTRGEVQFQEIEHNGEIYYGFGDLAYLKTTPTNYKIFNRNEYYTLEVLIDFWHNIKLTHGLYVKEAASRNITPVTRIDRKNLQEYLSGERDDLPETTAAFLPSGPPIPVKNLLAAMGETEAKRQRLDEDGSSQKLDQGPVEVRALSENLTVHKIAELKRKHQLQQKKNIVATDESVPSGTLTSSRDYPIERIHKNRINVLNGTKDLTNVLDVFASVQKIWSMDEKKTTVPHGNAAVSQQRGGYSRYAQEDFTKDKSADFHTEMSFIGSNLRAIQSGGLLSSIAKPKLPMAATPQERPIPTAVSSAPQTPGRTSCSTSALLLRKKRRQEGNKTTDLLLQRQKDGQTFNVRVVDNVTRFTEDDWDRVIGVFVMGPAWQFKGWKWNGNPVEIFSHVPAFHLHYDHDKPQATVRNWNVQKVPVNLTKRHVDKARFGQIWESIENFCRKSKPHLCARLGIQPL
ncbi:unnamed protein product [Caenorhabditis auriculariae]|uniref:Cell division control protein 73 C-terminal domain-containing protein n=1 Tax=Caenorhabditis auriculariae TaxID=2777116 RepID=A0A8S1HKC5_9PELO|nr:unnamed protein product [Caenorhabditis auriculariae]